MFKALMGGGRSSDTRSNSSSKAKSRRGADSKASSTVSPYSTSGGHSRRYASSAAGDSVASSYATAEPAVSVEPERIVIERTPKRRNAYDSERRGRDRGNIDEVGSRRRDRPRSSSRDREHFRSSRESGVDDAGTRDRESRRRRTRSGDAYLPAASSGDQGASGRPRSDIPQFPPEFHNTLPGTSAPESPNTAYDPHVQQQFPGQFPAFVAEPYRPPNPAGEASEYYGDQGQSVAEQPGVRPKPQAVIPHHQAHLMTASPSANPPPEPSSMGQVGAAADYYTDDIQDEPPPEQSGHSPPVPAPKPPKPSAQPSGSTVTAAAAAYGVEESIQENAVSNLSPAPVESPAITQAPNSHSVDASIGVAVAGTAAGYMIGHHQQTSSVDHSQQNTVQNYEEISQNGLVHTGPSIYLPTSNAPLYTPGDGVPVGYAAHPSHPHHAALYHGSPFQAGGLAFQQPQRGPLDKFIDFWRDPEGVGMFEDYTEAIGICKYCFEPGTTSRDAPRKHNHKPHRRSGDRYSSGSRVDKLGRYASSEDESRRRKKSSRNSWLPGMLAGYTVMSLFNNKGFDDTYSVRSGQVKGSSYDSDNGSIERKSQTSRGVYRRSPRSRSRDSFRRNHYTDKRLGINEGSRMRSHSRSRSSSRTESHFLRDAALGAAVGATAMSGSKARDRSCSPNQSQRARTKSRKSSSSDSSVVDVSRSSRKSLGGGLSSFFTASSENRRKRRTKKRSGLFSFNNSSSSSLDADLAFGNGYAKRSGKLKKRGSKKNRADVDATLLGLGAAATALAAKSHHKNRRAGEILAGKDSRSGRSDYSSATNDEGWEDLDSGDQSPSSISSALAFGGDDSQSSDSGTSLWGWRWGNRKNKKKKSSLVAAVGAGALGATVLASDYYRDGKSTSQDGVSSTGSLQHVAPVSTNDPSRFDAIRESSLPSSQPAFIRPGPIPLRQPQPVTPVSQAVYTTQGESVLAYSAPPTGAPLFGGETYYPYRTRVSESRDKPWAHPERKNVASRPPGRSGASPVFPTESLEGSRISGPQRRSTMKDQASVQFDLTEEQEDKERRADRLERLRSNAEYENGVQLIDRENEPRSRDAGRLSTRYRDRDHEKIRVDDNNEEQRGYRQEPRKESSPSWIGAAAAGTIGAAAAATVLSSKTSNDGTSEPGQHYHDERREKRRAERRRFAESEPTVLASMSGVDEGRSYSARGPEHVKTSAFRDISRKKPVYDDYAQFFAPEVQRYSPDTYTRREPTSMPPIIEAEPAGKDTRTLNEEPHPDYGGLPWPVPVLKVIEPTPPQSLSGSVRDISSPIMSTPDIVQEDSKPKRQTSGSRVSWGEHELHEYEVPSTSSEVESVDHDVTDQSKQKEKGKNVREDREISTKNDSSAFEHDIEFAATVAAATAAAGFDPSLVTDDPAYHRRSSSPGSESRENFVSPWAEVRFDSRQPYGFVEGEAETADNMDESQSVPRRFVDNGPLYSEPETVVRQTETGHESRAPATIAQEVIEQLGGRRDIEVNEISKESVNPTDDTQRNAGWSESSGRPQSPHEEVYAMPGGFEQDSPGMLKDGDSRSAVSAPVSGEFASSLVPKSRTSADGSNQMDDAAASTVEDGGAEGKRKRRKRRSKRDSDGIEETVSVASSPARIGKIRGQHMVVDEKAETRSGGFLSGIFGSMVSEPVDSKRSSSAERRSSREVQSEIGTRVSEESRNRRKERSSRRRSNSGRDPLEDDSAPEDGMAAEKENINIEGYKSSRQRREERRRQRYEGILEAGKDTEYEKARDSPQNYDDGQYFLAEGSELPVKVDDGDHSFVSEQSSSTDAEARRLGLELLEQRPRSRSASPPSSAKAFDMEPKSQSRPTSPEMARRHEEGRDWGMSPPSMMRSMESPTAVPLHFRRPPTSPGVQRSPSAISPVPPSPNSPTQARPRRPASTEFKSSREIRPLWLVERHGSSKADDQPHEPLPSLPSSKTSSATASVEDLTVLPDETSWEMLDLSHYVHNAPQPRGTDIAFTRRYSDNSQCDILDSQQGTPTAKTFGQVNAPSSSRKDKPKYEFHSPSELLQDPSAYADLPPSSTMEALPSAESSVVGVQENVETQGSLPHPYDRASTPEGKSIEASIPKEVGFASAVDAAVAAAVGAGMAISSDMSDTEAKDMSKSAGVPFANDEDTPAAIDKDDILRNLSLKDSLFAEKDVEAFPPTSNTKIDLTPVDSVSAVSIDEKYEDANETVLAERANEPRNEDFAPEIKPVDEFLDNEEGTNAGATGEDVLEVGMGVAESEAGTVPVLIEDSSYEPWKEEIYVVETPASGKCTEAAPEGESQAEEKSVEVVAPVSSKKKKKDRKRKNKGMNPDTPESTLTTGDSTATAPQESGQSQELLSQEPVLGASPEELESGTQAEPETSLALGVEETHIDIATSSKKIKRDKKRKKSKGSVPVEASEEPSSIESAQLTAETTADEKDAKPIAETTSPKAEEAPSEEAFKETQEVLSSTTQELVEPSPEIAENLSRDMPALPENTLREVTPAEVKGGDKKFLEPVDALQGSAGEFNFGQEESPESTQVNEDLNPPAASISEEGVTVFAMDDDANDTPPADVQGQMDATGSECVDSHPQPTELVEKDRKEIVGDGETTALEDSVLDTASTAQKEGIQGVPGADSPSISTDHGKTVLDSDVHSQEAEAIPENEATLSRKSSKKKKKNKDKSGIALSTEGESEGIAPHTLSGETVPEAEFEPAAPGESEVQSTQTEETYKQDETSLQVSSKVDGSAPEATTSATDSTVVTSAETHQEVVTEESWEVQPKKTGKKSKKDPKSMTSLHEPQMEPEAKAKPEESVVEDAAETPLPQISGEVHPTDDREVLNKQFSGAGEVEATPLTAENESNPVENGEANDVVPHVSDQAPKSLSGPDVGETASTKKSKKKKSKKQSTSSIANDSSITAESSLDNSTVSLDATAPPLHEETATEEPQEFKEEELIESEPPAPQDRVSPEPALIMTATQKKKARKEKKKQRQPSSLDKTVIPTPPSEKTSTDGPKEDLPHSTTEVPIAQEPEKTQITADAEHEEEQSKEEATVATESSIAAEKPVGHGEPEQQGAGDIIEDTTAVDEQPGVESEREQPADETSHGVSTTSIPEEPLEIDTQLVHEGLKDVTTQEPLQEPVQEQSIQEPTQVTTPDDPVNTEEMPEKQPDEERTTAEDSAQHPLEESKPDASAKSKKQKKKKKKRQSEQTTPATEGASESPSANVEFFEASEDQRDWFQKNRSRSHC
ncbi:hypothetical protein EYZ11_011021 [Aspergillus tanneri]|uniref:Involucrin repeat protein n=1 Tax=Aspergillus tanneri TaxID=1220188 RepID=A0A4S3J4G9_9EURO|nr:hypothetical protein EYZ11_011021 [Aspergillus tanneri]